MNGQAALALISAICVAAAIFISGCGGAPGDTPSYLPLGAMVLHIADADDVPTLDPAAGYDTMSWTFEQAIFDTLVRYGDANIELEPDLAATWESSPDATVFTYHMRHDAQFSDGRPVTSADIRYGIERVLDPATRSRGTEYYRGIAGAAEFEARRASHVSGIETPDAWTIIFHLSAPDPIFGHKLAMPFASAIPRDVAEKWGDDFSSHVIGSGAFMLKEWTGGQRIVLVKNPYYFAKGLPHLDAIVDSLGVNPELQWLRFDAGQIDALTDIPPAEFPYVMKTKRLRDLTLKQTTVTTRYLGMNVQMPPFDDVRVRRAINYAIDRKKLVAILNGRGIVARGVMPPNLPSYDPDLTGYDFDPVKARALLKEAGLKAGFTFDLWMRADNTLMMLGQSIQQDLAPIGVNAVLKPVAWGPLLEAIRQPHTVPAFLQGWEADFPDPENFLGALLSRAQWGSNNDTFYSNPEVEKLLAQAAPETDLKKRYALYDEAEKIIVADAPWACLYYPVTYVIRQPWVNDYTINPMRPTRFERIWLSPHER
ncbi:MAG TPA: ABC transporter substrate-binding protein [Candidatus Binataceae bacterium]|nr:ABC transporter substrate-binding protein [Candidatus Binataceae bacterium]